MHARHHRIAVVGGGSARLSVTAQRFVYQMKKRLLPWLYWDKTLKGSA